MKNSNFNCELFLLQLSRRISLVEPRQFSPVYEFSWKKKKKGEEDIEMKQEIDGSGSSLLHTYNLVGESLISVMGGRIVHCDIKRKEGKRFRRVERDRKEDLKWNS